MGTVHHGNTQPSIDQEEHAHVNGQGLKKVGLVDPFGGLVTKGNFLQQIDSANATTVYIGSARSGATTSAASWQIKKIATNGTIVTINWAAGTDAFTNIWDNRAILSYS